MIEVEGCTRGVIIGHKEVTARIIEVSVARTSKQNRLSDKADDKQYPKCHE